MIYPLCIYQQLFQKKVINEVGGISGFKALANVIFMF